MNQLHIFPDTQRLAEEVATKTIAQLHHAIDMYDTAVWVLAGGTAPMLAYEIIAKKYLDTVDWARVTFAIGDERIGPQDGPDNNWHAIEQVFLRHVPQATFMRPQVDQPVDIAADDYDRQLGLLPQTENGLPRLDAVWMGMGEDGHTLSLFPGHPNTAPSERLVVPIHNAPKPPADRISLTIHALGGAQMAMVIASGEGKATALKQVFNGEDLPVSQAANSTNAEWFVDQAAASRL